MQQNIKDVAELDKLLSESTSQTVMKADLAKFKRIADILNSKTNIPKEFAKMLKSKIMMLKHPRSQMMLFEIIEYTTCKCFGPLHTEFNNRDFLQTVNSIFNQKQLSDEVRNKLLSIIQFWNAFFDNRKDIYPNFSWYFNLIQSRKVPFPPFKQSPYADQKGLASNQQSLGDSRGGSGGPADDHVFDSMNEKQKKLFKDLNLVFDNVKLANDIMDQNEQDLEEVMDMIVKTEGKLGPLLDKLQQSNEGFLHAYCQGLIQDSTFTVQRYQRYKQRQPTPRLNSNALQIIEMAKQMFAQSQPQPQAQPHQTDSFEFGSQQQTSHQQDSFGFGSQPAQAQQNRQASGVAVQNQNQNQNQPAQEFGFNHPVQEVVQTNQDFGFGNAPQTGQPNQPAQHEFGFGSAPHGGHDAQQQDQGFGFQHNQQQQAHDEGQQQWNQNNNQGVGFQQEGENLFGNPNDFAFDPNQAQAQGFGQPNQPASDHFGVPPSFNQNQPAFDGF